MSPLIGNQETLLERVESSIRTGERQIVFLAGSGLTSTVIPGVDWLVTEMRGAFSRKAAESFDREVGRVATGTEKYQVAAAQVILNYGQSSLNEIVRRETLRAVRTEVRSEGTWPAQTDEDFCEQIEGEPKKWEIPKGVASLGNIVWQIPEPRRGSILTTNFDPLIEVSLNRGACRASSHYLDSDGSISTYETGGHPHVIHLHGYWRKSDTLSNTLQLDEDRIRLSEGISSVLRRSTLVVLGYRGWNDVFTRALVRIAKAREYDDLDVLWTVFGEAAEYLDSWPLSDLKNHSRVTFYENIDCNSFLPELELRLRSIAPTAIPSVGVDLPIGWMVIDESFLALRKTQERMSTDRVLGYFDGRPPDWTDAQNPRIPARPIVEEIKEGILGSGGIHAILGPTGEGKSTVLRQTVCRLMEDAEDIKILWRTGRGPIPEGFVSSQLKSCERVLVVIDEAEDALLSIFQTFGSMGPWEANHSAFLIASSESEWRALIPSSMEDCVTPHFMRGIAYSEATQIVQAWEGLGSSSALGQLALVEPSGRAQALYSAAQNALATNGFTAEGALFGALLTVRFGENLAEHIDGLMGRLEKRHATADFNLKDVFLVVCLMHATEKPGDRRGVALDRMLLADLLRISERDLDRLVLEPLSDEAATSLTKNFVIARHRQIAEVVLYRAGEEQHASEQNFQAMRHIMQELIFSTHGHASRSRSMTPEARSVVTLGRRLKYKTLAICAGLDSLEASPSLLSVRINLAWIYRRFECLDESIDVYIKAVERLSGMTDRGNMVRPMAGDWATSAGRAGHAADSAVLDSIVVADQTSPIPPSGENVARAMAGASLSFLNLYRAEGGQGFLQAAAASVRIGVAAQSGPRADHHLSVNGKAVNDFEIDWCSIDISRAVDDFISGVASSADLCRGSYSWTGVPPSKLTFHRLRSLVGKFGGEL
ncbi:SIR2 family protein [Streptomyces platensis]|uniref:P-loop NTPase n=1 Tax=Streptomyces platensis TaxID=58346 RepID=UPI002E276AAF